MNFRVCVCTPCKRRCRVGTAPAMATAAQRNFLKWRLKNRLPLQNEQLEVHFLEFRVGKWLTNSAIFHRTRFVKSLESILQSKNVCSGDTVCPYEFPSVQLAPIRFGFARMDFPRYSMPLSDLDLPVWISLGTGCPYQLWNARMDFPWYIFCPMDFSWYSCPSDLVHPSV